MRVWTGVNRITLHLEKPEKHDYSQEIKICFTDLNVCSYYVLLIWLDKNGILWFSAITHNTSSITRKTSDKPQLKAILHHILPVTLSIVKVIQTKGSLRNCHSQDRPNVTWQRNVTGLAGWALATEKEHETKLRNKMQTSAFLHLRYRQRRGPGAPDKPSRQT